MALDGHSNSPHQNRLGRFSVQQLSSVKPAMESEAQNTSGPKLLSVKPTGEDDLGNRPAVVVVRNATKYYGKGNVVEGLNMTVKLGTVYSFLGSSGCGKSTTLECIVGLRKFTSGTVVVLGREPGTRGSDVPGKSVGYMPQDYSLYNQLSIVETLIYFGTLNGMNSFEISKALGLYNDLLNLPKYSTRVGALSGGQKRRVSLVVALIHNPPLVILDEPTVGMDPLLCASVLKHLTQLARTEGTTVLITTHYIEGARHSDTVGVMRNGKLIAETSPQELLQDYEETSLESVVLKLCKADDVRTDTNLQIHNVDFQEDHFALLGNLPNLCSLKSVRESLSRTRALVWKNIFTLRRNLVMLYLSLFFPAVGSFALYYCFEDPRSVNFGVVNTELDNGVKCEDFANSWNQTCASFLWSCKYLDQLNTNKFMLSGYPSTEEAEMGVRLGKIWGFIYFPSNFTDELFERGVMGTEAYRGNSSTSGSDIIIRMDKSSKIMASLTEFEFTMAYSTFLKQIFDDCDLNSKKVEYSLNFKEPIFGKGLSFSDFVLPSFFIIQMLFMPIVSSGSLFVSDKRNKTMQRAVVGGAQLWEIFLSYTVAELGMSIIRLALLYGAAKFIIGIQVEGSLLLEGALALSIGAAGMALGFLLGLLCNEEIEVALLAIGTYCLNLMLSGSVWPLEGLPDALKTFAYFLPVTLPTDALRSMSTRGWGLESWDVQLGFISALSYVLIIFSSVVLVSKRYKPW